MTEVQPTFPVHPLPEGVLYHEGRLWVEARVTVHQGNVRIRAGGSYHPVQALQCSKPTKQISFKDGDAGNLTSGNVVPRTEGGSRKFSIANSPFVSGLSQALNSGHTYDQLHEITGLPITVLECLVDHFRAENPNPPTPAAQPVQ